MPTQLISIPAKTWVQLPTATRFLAQNNAQHVILIQATPNTPVTIFGHALQPRLSMSNLNSEAHWAYSEQPTNITFTENDL